MRSSSGERALFAIVIEEAAEHVHGADPLSRAAAVRGRTTYFHADTAEDLHRVYHTLTSQVVLENKRREVTALLTGLGALLMLSSGGLSLAWWSRFA